jgi:hypothetical protein
MISRSRAFIPRLLLGAFFLALPLSIPAQSAPVLDATHLTAPRALDTIWLVQSGDSPAYADSAFDDSRWTRFDPSSPINAIYGRQRPAVIWYRQHIRVDPAQKNLALSEWGIARAFEVYVNGQRVLASGTIDPFRPYTLDARLLVRLPDGIASTGTLLVAVRVRIDNVEWTSGQNPGYYANNLILGDADVLYRDNWLNIIGGNALHWLDHILGIGLAIVALVLFFAERRQTAYLWIALIGALTAVQWLQPCISEFHNIPQYWQILTALTRFVSPYFWAMFYFSIVGQRIGWRWRSFLIFAGICDFFSALQGTVLNLPLPVQFFIGFPFVILLSVIVPVLYLIHWRRGNREAGFLLMPVIFFSLYIYAEVGLETLFQFPAWRPTALRGLNLIDNYPAGPFHLSLNYVSGILFSISLAIIILLRSSRTSRRQALLESELQAAQQVQQVLVPEQTSPIPGFSIESVYLPAQQVGGDFFQILPIPNDGLLVVVGDVAGKGLPAAMLVSVLVGAIRATAEFTHDPAALLSSLNDRLVGREGGGFTTALAAHIDAAGRVTLANAGHLPPYLDGREVDVPGAFPLGVASGAQYDLIRFQLAPGSRLTFYSDGVVEAQNSGGELFGFDRSRDLSTRTAREIAEAARLFGQQDDITVVAIERQPAPLIRTAASPMPIAELLKNGDTY